MPNLSRIAGAALFALAAGAGAQGRFRFDSIEYAPPEQRLPAAQAFVRSQAAPGTPMQIAVAAMRRAGAGCGSRPAANGAILCRSSRVVSDSFDNLPIGDVTWTVRLYPAGDGTVRSAAVRRDRTGP